MKFAGSPLLKQTGSFSWSRAGGYIFRPVYEGISQNVTAVARELQSRGIPFELDRDGATATLRTQQPTQDESNEQEQPTGSWACQGGEESVDIRFHPKFATLGGQQKLLIKRLIDGDCKLSPEDDSGNSKDVVYRDDAEGANNGTDLVAFKETDAWYFYYLAFNGTTHFTRSTFTLAHTQIVSSSFSEAENNFDLIGQNINCIYTTSKLLTECNRFSPDPITSLCSSQVSRAESALMSQMADNDVDAEDAIAAIETKYAYLMGWLKGTPSLTDDGRGRAQLSVFYRLQLWSNILYRAAQ